METYEIKPCGDSGVLVVLGKSIDPIINKKVHCLREVIENNDFAARFHEVRGGVDADKTSASDDQNLLIRCHGFILQSCQIS